MLIVAESESASQCLRLGAAHSKPMYGKYVHMDTGLADANSPTRPCDLTFMQDVVVVFVKFENLKIYRACVLSSKEI